MYNYSKKQHTLSSDARFQSFTHSQLITTLASGQSE